MEDILRKTEICLDAPVSSNNVLVAESKTVQHNAAQPISAPNTGIGGDGVLLAVLLIAISTAGMACILKKNKRFVMFVFAAIFGAMSLGVLPRIAYATIPGCQKVGYSKYEVAARIVRDGYEVEVIRFSGTGEQAKDIEAVMKIKDEHINSNYGDIAYMVEASVKSPNWDDERQIYKIEYDSPMI